MIIDLKPCPFCGGEGEISQESAPTYNRFYPRCTNSKCIASNMMEDGEFSTANVGFDTPDEAATAWNTRPEEEQAQQEIERLRSGLEKFADKANYHPRLFYWRPAFQGLVAMFSWDFARDLLDKGQTE